MERHLAEAQLLDQEAIDAFEQEAEAFAADLRELMQQEPMIDPAELFEHVYAEPTPALRRQHGQLMDELARESES
jgi:pyruvate dehydrogenase E1 component alpha subunit